MNRPIFLSSHVYPNLIYRHFVSHLSTTSPLPLSLTFVLAANHYSSSSSSCRFSTSCSAPSPSPPPPPLFDAPSPPSLTVTLMPPPAPLWDASPSSVGAWVSEAGALGSDSSVTVARSGAWASWSASFCLKSERQRKETLLI